MEQAEAHVECNPRDGEPPRPIFRAKHKCAADNCSQFNKDYPDNVILKWMLNLILAEMKDKRDHANHDVHPTDDCDSERTLVHSGVNTARLGSTEEILRNDGFKIWVSCELVIERHTSYLDQVAFP